MIIRNAEFEIGIDEATGFVDSIVCVGDDNEMNWCAGDGKWGRIHGHELGLISCVTCDNRSEAVFADDKISVTVSRRFKDGGNYIESYAIRNISASVICVNRDNFGIETPFNDRYTNADECMVRHCHTHIWCGHHTAWINALKMGISDINLGLILTKGALDCYSQDGCKSNNRGIFILNPESVFLKSGETYELEWELFRHSGESDFQARIAKYERMIGIVAAHYTVFEGEPIELAIKVNTNIAPEIFCRGESIPASYSDGAYRVEYYPPAPGEYRFIVKSGEYSTYADIMVKLPFAELLEKRVRFIVRNQQCLDPESPLYGAFLVYDNDSDSMYFDYFNPDHNACRERLNIPFLLLKYLQLHDDAEVRAAIDRFIKFVFREFYDETTGEVFNTIGKNRDQLRLYNAPGVMLLFAEMYFVTRDEAYLSHIIKLAENYYGVGGKKCYANGLAIGKVMRAFRMAGREADGERVMELFHTHVDNIIGNGTSYPKHEVNYEQTIVTPAVTHISEMGMLCENREYYISEAKKHIECLERFSGHQPSFHLNEIAIRYWDDYWFGKNRTFGDTLPHHLSCLTARSYIAYSRLTGETEWLDRAEECIRNCMCLIGDDGRGSAACVYPYRLDGRRGEFFDPWSNDQDLVLYDALYLNELNGAFGY